MTAKKQPNVSIYEGKGKETGKPYKALLVTVGEWSQLVFTKSKFEMDYIEQYLKDYQLLHEFDSTKGQK